MIKTLESEPSEWKIARQPNYDINTDFEYPYSECPHLGEYELERIPQSGLIEHVDYWGEGRIKVREGISGFPDCYNVNHTYQLVSNGAPDTIKRKIPNRIPVPSYTDCRTNAYIKDNSVKIVTLMGAPINKSCATDIARILNGEEGIVVLYGIDRNIADVKNLDETLNPNKIVYCPGFELPKSLQGLTLFDRHLAYVNLTDYSETLYNTITSAEYDEAVKMCQELFTARQAYVISEVFGRLLKGDNPKTMTFAYKLWIGGGDYIVWNWLPSEFRQIFRGDNMQIISKFYDQALKLDSNTDGDNDRLAWGAVKDETTNRLIWKFYPQMDNKHAVFKIKNNEHSMFLKLDSTSDSKGDRKCYGSTKSDEKRHLWELEPIRFKYNDELLFFLVNHEYRQCLKLDHNTDTYGDRLVWGHNGNYADDQRYFGWLLKPI